MSMFVSYVGDAKISGSFKDDIQIKNTNRLHSVAAGCDQPVGSGAWYFETRCVSGCAIVGWAASGYRKHLTSGSAGEVFYVDFNKSVLVGGRTRIRTGHVSVNAGDIIGCLIDFSNRCVSFSFNGEFVSDLSIKGADLSCHDGYHPIVELRAGCSACVSVVEASFIAGLPKGCRPYGSVGQSDSPAVSNTALSDLFDKFVSKQSPNKCNEDELLELFKAVGEQSETDPIAFVLLWFVNKDTHVWEVTRENFVNAFGRVNCTSMEAIGRYLRNELNSLLKHKGEAWLSFYKYVFYLLPEPGSRMINAEKAAGVWEVLGFKSWKFFDQWVAFITERQQEQDEEAKEKPPEDKSDMIGRKVSLKPKDPALVGLDVWQSFPKFVEDYSQSLDSYDLDDLSFNSLFTDFVERVRG